MALQCRSTVTWTECVAATALEDGCVLPTSTQAILHSSVQMRGDSSQLRGGCADE